jgi:hypothetical protein
LRVDDRVQKTVVFVGTAEKGGPFIPHGTAFVTAQLHDEIMGWQTIVTAKHVIEGIDSPLVYLRVNSNNGEARICAVEKEWWVSHPDPRIDVMVCPTEMTNDQFDISHFPLFGPGAGQNCALTKELIDQYYIGIGDDVYVPGMFVARLGQRQNLPILRIGTIAAMPDEPIETKYGLHDAFLVEVRSIDGLSGSPVCINMIDRTIPPYAPRRGLPHPAQPRPGYLLAGMVLGYNEVYNPRDAIEIRERASDPVTRAIVPLNTGIAVVLPIWRILEATEQLNGPRQRELKRSNREKGHGFVPSSAAPLGAMPSDRNEKLGHREAFNRLVSAAAKKRP